MKILTTGSNGLLGQKLVHKLSKDSEVELIATARGENRLSNKEGYKYHSLDITDEKAVAETIVKYKPDSVIHTAAMTNVDACEADKEGCDKLNVDATQYIVDACKANNAHLVHLSTDFIFDGKDGPYDEEAKPNPISYYGESKLKAEEIVLESGQNAAILRTVLVYGIAEDMSRSNIALWAKGALQKGQQINVVDDQFRSPTLAEDLADGCILAAKQKAKGIYNISGKDQLSVLEIVQQVADFWKLDKDLINPVSSTTLSQPAKRPPKTGFILDKAIRELGYKPHSFMEGLAVLDEQMK
ncbi:dTDP-4-dehydrorhamnose reductase [Owenweeksia hongkongensis DSM 17368]|uniref:dTDP-4-dehydrorhamnose reductase n=1 Tax=Owenweeksia hongkongensis (strain DSM 17368 / CIP 108786 / JCM 12287 / NRRL B-23963 / UST20020801) TaxID=926562 RepID=G8R840_OWEHD|nr:SDR family oxidoreductase [Owenweeksia hongkongensis]AEV32408.1 dTDP-4-dehydrorhamnose reductase [Owenweeksia hongkongensis DSM 17368]